MTRLLSFGRDYIKPVPAAAATQVFLATHPAMASTSGHYFEDCNPVIPPSRHAQDASLAGELWTKSEEMTSAYLA
jgi:hypothetical protein